MINFFHITLIFYIIVKVVTSLKPLIAIRGDITAANVNFIVVIDNDGTSSDRVSYHPGILKESLEEFLNGTIDIATGKRIYVAISTGKINWTKGLNTALDQKLNAYNS